MKHIFHEGCDEIIIITDGEKERETEETWDFDDETEPEDGDEE